MTLNSKDGTPITSSEVAPGEPLAQADSTSEDLSEGSTDQQPEALQETQEEFHEYKDKYLRLLAEFENYKRRAQRDQNEAIRYANENLLNSLLPIIDNLERAISSGKDSNTSGPLLEGVELTHKHFLETVEKLGVRQISSLGNSFDPTMHQAVAQVESETVAPHIVVEEFQKGYFLHDRILRPAMVTVAKEKSENIDQSSDKESGNEGGIQA